MFFIKNYFYTDTISTQNNLSLVMFNWPWRKHCCFKRFPMLYCQQSYSGNTFFAWKKCVQICKICTLPGKIVSQGSCHRKEYNFTWVVCYSYRDNAWPCFVSTKCLSASYRVGVVVLFLPLVLCNICNYLYCSLFVRVSWIYLDIVWRLQLFSC